MVCVKVSRQGRARRGVGPGRGWMVTLLKTRLSSKARSLQPDLLVGGSLQMELR